MKKIFSLVAAMFIAGNMLAATDVYLSATGNDENAGTEDAPVATLAKAYELCDANGTIHVSGIITVSEKLDNGDGGKNVNFAGTTNTKDGFSGGGLSAILRLWNKNTTISNLTFKEGANTTNDGGAIEVGGGTVTVTNCIFKDNTSSNCGGAVKTSNATGVFENCEFSGNTGNEGGALDVRGGSFTANNCKIHDNTTTSNGAIDCVDIKVYMTGTQVYNNTTTNTAGGMRITGGGCTEVKILQCAIVGNTATTGHAGGIHFVIPGTKEGTTYNYLIEGTTIANNRCHSRGGGIWFDGNTSNADVALKLLNCTVFNNCAFEANAGNCGGLSFWGFAFPVYIDNCILAGNTSKDQAWGDLLSQACTIYTRNSYVSSYVDWDGGDETTFKGNATDSQIGVDGTFLTNYGLTTTQYDAEGMYFPVFAKYPTIYPASTMGNATLAEGYKDQLGQTIGTIIGAVQKTHENAGQGQVVPGVLDASKFDLGGKDNAYGSWDGDNTPSRGTDHFGWTQSGCWVNYTVDVAESAFYDITVNCATDNSTPTGFSFYSDGKYVGTYSQLGSTGGWDTYTDGVVAHAVYLEAGTHTITIKDIKNINLKTVTFAKSENQAYGFILRAYMYDDGGDGVAYDGWNDGDAKPNGDSSDFYVHNSSADCWAKYTVNVAEAGVYDVIANLEGDGDVSAVNVYNGDTKCGGIATTADTKLPGWGNGWGVRTFNAAVELTAGEQTLTLKDFNSINVNTLQFIKNEVATGIQTVAPQANNGKWYNLQGIEVANPTKGIFIHNGKKVIK